VVVRCSELRKRSTSAHLLRISLILILPADISIILVLLISPAIILRIVYQLSSPAIILPLIQFTAIAPMVLYP